MAWDTVTHRLITKSRLLLASPDVAYEALEEYGQYLRERVSLFEYDEDLEAALAGRDDRLIDLGLAKNAGSGKLVGGLYKRSVEGTENPQYDMAMRLACLANRNLATFANVAIVSADEFKRLAMEGDADELIALLRNPRNRGLLVAAFEPRGTVLNDIPDARWFRVVLAAVDNPALNTDTSNRFGPDSLASNIQNAVVALLQTAPVEASWTRLLHQLLLNINPANAAILDNEATVSALLARWRDASVPKIGEAAAEDEGYYSSHTFVEEFCALLAALYGRVFRDKKVVITGALDAPDLLDRCAYYGQAQMSPNEMQEAWQKDDDLFAFAALFNDHILLQPESRTQLEANLPYKLEFLYERRCAQLKSKYPRFSPQAVPAPVEASQAKQPAPATSAAVESVSAQIDHLKDAVAAITKRLWWGFIILGIVIECRR